MFLCPYDHHKAAADVIGWRNVAAKIVHPVLAQKVSKEIGVKKHSPLLISYFSHIYLSIFILYIVIETWFIIRISFAKSQTWCGEIKPYTESIVYDGRSSSQRFILCDQQGLFCYLVA